MPPRGSQDPYLVKLGRRVKSIRLELKLTQEDLEAKSAVDRVYLSRIESGRQNPSILTLRAIAKALRVPFSALLPDE
jgi:transcriptional regulator with XRE-family HTH domain